MFIKLSSHTIFKCSSVTIQFVTCTFSFTCAGMNLFIKYHTPDIVYLILVQMLGIQHKTELESKNELIRRILFLGET